MKNKTEFFTHTTALSALYVLGNAIIVMPKSTADEFNFLGYMAASAVAFILFAAAIVLSKHLFSPRNENSGIFKKSLFSLVYFAISLFALWCLADTFKIFVLFAADTMIRQTAMSFSVIIFAAVVIYFSLKRQENILKFSLIAFFFVAAVVIFFFIACIPRYDLRNIFVFKLPKMSELAIQTKPYILNPVIPSLFLPVYNMLAFKNTRAAAEFCGLCTGLVVLGICTVGSVLIFSAEFAGELNYPYAATVSTVSFGRLFTRLDGFTYFVYFVSCTIRSTVCAFVMYKCLKKINMLLSKGGS